jgi:hypothetical protein
MKNHVKFAEGALQNEFTPTANFTRFSAPSGRALRPGMKNHVKFAEGVITKGFTPTANFSRASPRRAAEL